MPPALELKDRRFNRWVVINKSDRRDKSGRIYWNCICDCGNNREVIGNLLITDHSKSCGCYQSDLMRLMLTTHGMSNSKNPLYEIWRGIKGRCYNKNNNAYKDYGGRKITMCDEWKNDFQKFYEDMKEGYQEGLTIEREKVNGNYEKSNCCWKTKTEQTKNKRSSVWIETLEGRMIVADAAKKVGISWTAMMNRVNKNWPIEKLLVR